MENDDDILEVDACIVDSIFWIIFILITILI